MFLLIKKLPKDVTEHELAKSVSMASASIWHQLPFVSGPTLKRCDILRVVDKQKESVEFHGLISVNPSKACNRIMKKLNGSILFGKPIEVRPYIKRTPYKDRRREFADLELLTKERRKRDRRHATAEPRNGRNMTIRYY